MGNDHTAWMPVYWRDLLAETSHLCPAHFGAYCLLLATHWNTRRPLPDDPDKLRRIARMDAPEWADAAPALAAFFIVAEGRWTHANLMAELRKSEERYLARADAGRKGGQAKGKHGLSRASPSNKQPQAQAHKFPSGNSESPPAHVALAESSDLENSTYVNRRSELHAARLSPDWQPDQDGYAAAFDLGLDRTTVDNVAAQFRDYWHGRPGRAGLKQDWPATWRVWLRRHVNDHGAGPWPAASVGRSKGDRQSRGGVVAAVREIMSQG